MHNKRHHFYVFLLFLLCQVRPTVIVSAQPKVQLLDFTGQSKIQHYTKKDFHIDAQFWSMTEDKDGVLYFGHNKGISIFNGNRWSQLSLPNGSSVKAIKRSFDNQIFVGGWNEFGTIELDPYGQYYYKSLLDLLPANDRKIDEVWQILSFDNKVIIRSFRSIVILENNKVKLLASETAFNYINEIGNYIYVVDHLGISRLDPNSLELTRLFEAKQYNHEQIISLQPTTISYELLGFSRQGKSFLINLKNTTIQTDEILIEEKTEDQIFSVLHESKNKYLIGTINKQILQYNYHSKEVQQWRSDLQNPTVLNIQKSENGDIWAMLNRGIDCIETSFPSSVIFDRASVYSAVIHQGYFYIATNQGVYAAKMDSFGQLNSSKFKIISNLVGQAWTLNVHNEQLFVGHDNGAFLINALTSHHIAGTGGIWKVIDIKGKPDLLMACGYDGIYILEKNKGFFRVVNKIENFDTSSRDIMQTDEPGVFWVCHGYEGVYNIKINKEYTRVVAKEHFTDKNGLPSQFNINVMKYEDELVFLSKFGIYAFDPTRHEFVKHPSLNERFQDNLDISKLVKHGDRTWFIQEAQMGYFDEKEENTLHKKLFSSLNGDFITSLEYLKPLANQKIMVGTNEGLFLFDLSAKKPIKKAPTLINRISYKLNNDSLIYADLSASTKQLILPPDINSIIFYFSAPGLKPKKDIEFSYQLAGFDKEWNRWSTSTSREFSYLNHGTYSFHVKGKSITGQEASETSFKLIILPVWYQTKVAYFTFAFIALLIALLVYRFVLSRLRKIEEEGKQIRQALETEIEAVKLQKEKELIQKDNHRLSDDIVNKSKEIANYTLLMVKKHDLLDEIGTEINEIKKFAKLDKTKNSLRIIAQKISMNLRDEDHLKIFDTNFERVHLHFFKKIRANFPDINQKELRLCGFIKMDMTNKEIASVLNISARGVESAKYRLRKNLNIDLETSMIEFLDQLTLD